MKVVKKKIPAKLNLTLDVIGVQEKYHEINSLVCSVDVYDYISVRERKDNRITLKMKGLPVDCEPIDNNAFKAASMFIRKFSTKGVDITITKNIPVGGGLGGSSADIAGVLLAMKELFDLPQSVESVANALGSDVNYMLNGGFATLSGRGEVVKSVQGGAVMPLLFITHDKMISAKDCYKKFDQLKKTYPPTTFQAVKMLGNNDLELAFTMFKNDLEPGAKKIEGEIEFNLHALKKANAKVAMVAGSGPTVCGIFSDERERNRAYKKLKPLYRGALIKASSIFDEPRIDRNK